MTNHVPRSCLRCGDAAPRVWMEPVGWVHYYCLTPAEKNARRAKGDVGRKR